MSKWEWKKLGEVAKIYNGNSINANVKKERYSNVKSGFPFIATKDVGNDSEVDYENGIRIPFEEAGFKVARKDTVLICAEGGSAGKKKCILNEDVCFGNKLFAIDYNREKLIGKFVFYYTFEQSFTDEFQKLLSGIIGGVSSAKFKEIQIPIPPLSEQNRIVKFLDNEFSKIETLKTNAETNLKNAKELFETTLEKELNPLSRHSERSEKSSADLPSGWEWKKLGDLFKMVRGPFGGSLKKECFKKEGHPVYEQQNAIYSKFEFRYFIDDKKFEEMSRFRVEPGDFIMSCSGTMGKVAIVPPESSVGIINQALLKMSPQKGIISTYAKYYMMNSSFVDSLLKNAQGVAIKNVAAVKELKLIPFALPPLSVQKEIVARLDKLSENVKRLEANYKQIIANCDELKKSILKKTFEGES